MTYKKPLPKPTKWSAKFWDGTKRHKLLIQKCRKCNKYIFYPKIYCTYCFSEDLEWVQSSGKGIIYSYTVVMNNPVSSFMDDIPFVIAIVELNERVRMLSHIVGYDDMEIKCDMEVEVIFEELNDQFTIPKFRPIK